MGDTQKSAATLKSRKYNFKTVTTNNLDKISQNFSNLASMFSDGNSEEDYDNYCYQSSYLNITQSPDEARKRLRNDSKDTGSRLGFAPDGDATSMANQSHNMSYNLIQSATGVKEPMTGRKKSILKKKNTERLQSEADHRQNFIAGSTYQKKVLHTQVDATNNQDLI